MDAIDAVCVRVCVCVRRALSSPGHRPCPCSAEQDASPVLAQAFWTALQLLSAFTSCRTFPQVHMPPPVFRKVRQLPCEAKVTVVTAPQINEAVRMTSAGVVGSRAGTIMAGASILKITVGPYL